MTGEATLPRLLRRNAHTIPDRPAMREKHRGIWQTLTWRAYWEAVHAFASGLAAVGFCRGDKLSVIGDNRPRLYVAQLAAQCLGGIAVPVYQDSIAAELVYVFEHAEVGVIVAEDQEQVDKILSLKDRLPHLRLLVYDNPLGLAPYNIPFLHSFDDIDAEGRKFLESHTGCIETELEKGASDDVALLVYTSGTTGRSKGVMLSHKNLIASGEALAASEDIRANDEWLCYLPMAWVGDALYSTVMSLLVGFTCSCPESPRTVLRDLREVGPTAFLGPPRFWESLLTSLQVRAVDATPLKHKIFEIFRDLAERAELLRSERSQLSLLMRLGLVLGNLLVYGPVRDQLGLGRVRWAYTGGAPLGPDAFRFFRSFGINLKQIYGATEVCGVAALQPDNEADPNTVGRMCRGVGVQIASSGEVLVRSPGAFQGYYKQPSETCAAFSEDGWVHTGDAGFVDTRGHLVIIDRAKDVGKLADGSPFAPQFLENKLKFSPFINEAVAFGNARAFVVAMIAINFETVGKWAERRGIAYTSFQDLSAHPAVLALIRDEVQKSNATLPAAARVRRFLLLNKELDADDNEVTRTRKIRRRFVAEKYNAVIEALYGGESKVELVTDVTFEDGRKSTIRSSVPIENTENVIEGLTEPVHA
jgi:long-chain acyl-CoA synthetase